MIKDSPSFFPHSCRSCSRRNRTLTSKGKEREKSVACTISGAVFGPKSRRSVPTPKGGGWNVVPWLGKVDHGVPPRAGSKTNLPGKKINRMIIEGGEKDHKPRGFFKKKKKEIVHEPADHYSSPKKKQKPPGDKDRG